MKKYVAALLLGLSTPAIAEGVTYPGYTWVNVTGPHVGGEEAGNWVISGTVYQGVDVGYVGSWKLEPYASVNYSADTKKKIWNNYVDSKIGVRFFKPVGPGMLDLRAYVVNSTHLTRDNYSKTSSDTGPQFSVGYWVGWGR